MIRKMLYRTKRENGGYTVSPKRPEKGVPYRIRWRLIADEGRAITDGEIVTTVIDVQHRKDCLEWQDCEEPEEKEPAGIAPADAPDTEGETKEGEAYDD